MKLKEETTKRSEAEVKLSLAEANHAKQLADLANRAPAAGSMSRFIFPFNILHTLYEKRF